MLAYFIYLCMCEMRGIKEYTSVKITVSRRLAIGRCSLISRVRLAKSSSSFPCLSTHVHEIKCSNH
jgi:hypothetical protein